MLIFYALVKLSPHWSRLSTIPEVCVRLCKGSGGEAEDESLFPELELWLHTGPSKVTVWDNSIGKTRHIVFLSEQTKGAYTTYEQPNSNVEVKQEPQQQSWGNQQVRVVSDLIWDE